MDEIRTGMYSLRIAKCDVAVGRKVTEGREAAAT